MYISTLRELEDIGEWYSSPWTYATYAVFNTDFGSVVDANVKRHYNIFLVIFGTGYKKLGDNIYIYPKAFWIWLPLNENEHCEKI